MIDGIGRGGLPRNFQVSNLPGRVGVAGSAAAAGDAAPARAGGTLGRIAKDMAAAPPVDAGRVAALKQAIAGGSYRADPERIATAMLRLEGGRPG
ncbi:MAG: Anti-sigma-28 factor, FlgM [Pseudomonadota bacterium]